MVSSYFLIFGKVPARIGLMSVYLLSRPVPVRVIVHIFVNLPGRRFRRRNRGFSQKALRRLFRFHVPILRHKVYGVTVRLTDVTIEVVSYRCIDGVLSLWNRHRAFPSRLGSKSSRRAASGTLTRSFAAANMSKSAITRATLRLTRASSRRRSSGFRLLCEARNR